MTTVNKAVIENNMMVQTKEQIRRELTLGQAFEQQVVNDRERYAQDIQDSSMLEKMLDKLCKKRIIEVSYVGEKNERKEKEVPLLTQEDKNYLIEAYRQCEKYLKDFDKAEHKIKYKEMIHCMVINHMKNQGKYDP